MGHPRRHPDPSVPADVRLVDGEIWLRNPATFSGYLHDHALTRETLAEDGWLRTGDLATLGPNGAYTAILEAGVGGVPSPLGEHDVMAFVVFRDGLHPAEAEIAAFCAARLAAFKVPTRWRVLEALPRTATQRVAYHLLPR